MNGFIGTLAAQLALQPVSPAADGIASRPRRPVAECPRAQRTARAKLTAPSRRSAYLQQLRRVWWADSAAVRMRARVAAALPRPSRSRARAVTTLRRVASQQPMVPAPQVGRTSMRRHTQRTARADAPPVLQVGGAHQCPSRAPPSRPRAPMPRLFHRGGAHRRSWAPPHPADGLGRGTVGTSMLPLAQPKGGFAGDMLPRCVIGRSGMAAYARELYSPEAGA